MQQIYKSYDGSFEDYLSLFNSETYSLKMNYRSSKNIVKILNNIYNDSLFTQKCPDEIDDSNVPQIYITNDIGTVLNDIEVQYPEILKLYIYNKERFENIGAKNLYEKISNMEKYSFGRKYSPVDVLLKNDLDNPDPLFKLLFEIHNFLKIYKLKQYGLLIQKINNKKQKIYNKDLLKINKHEDKKHFRNLIEEIYRKYNENTTIIDFLKFLNDKKFVLNQIIENYLEDTDENEYFDVLNQKLEEFRNICQYLETPKISTQHGVKGEGHNEVVFIAEDSGNPSVKMYNFFELISKNNICYSEFEKFYYDYVKDIKKFESSMQINFSEVKKNEYEKYKNSFEELIKNLQLKYDGNIYYNFFFLNVLNLYNSKPNVTNFKELIKINTVFGTLTAYKLFYVGCSRAKKILKVIVNYSQINKFHNEFKTKMNNLGFHVVE